VSEVAGIELMAVATFALKAKLVRVKEMQCLNQCFGSKSGSGSMWIRIDSAPLNPDLDPYWENRNGIRIPGRRNDAQKRKTQEISG